MAQLYPPETSKKPCSRCGKHPRVGYHSWCTACRRDGNRKCAEARPEQYRAAKRRRYYANVERERECARRCYAANREKRRAAQRRYNETVDWSKKIRSPEKHRAGWMVREALISGRLLKPRACSACGARPRVENLHAHHTDYDKPLEVTWLCSICHGEAHRIGGNSDGANPSL